MSKPTPPALLPEAMTNERANNLLSDHLAMNAKLLRRYTIGAHFGIHDADVWDEAARRLRQTAPLDANEPKQAAGEALDVSALASDIDDLFMHCDNHENWPTTLALHAVIKKHLPAPAVPSANEERWWNSLELLQGWRYVGCIDLNDSTKNSIEYPPAQVLNAFNLGKNLTAQPTQEPSANYDEKDKEWIKVLTQKAPSANEVGTDAVEALVDNFAEAICRHWEPDGLRSNKDYIAMRQVLFDLRRHIPVNGSSEARENWRNQPCKCCGKPFNQPSAGCEEQAHPSAPTPSSKAAGEEATNSEVEPLQLRIEYLQSTIRDKTQKIGQLQAELTALRAAKEQGKTP